MFIHHFKYSLKILFRNKILIFWIFSFPIILATFFSMAFSNIEKGEKLNLIHIAIINNKDFNQNTLFKDSFKEMSNKNSKNRLFIIDYTTKDQAEQLLKDDKIIGYLNLINDDPRLTFKSSGINETIFKYVIEEVSQTYNIVKNLSKKEIEKEISSGHYQIDYQKISHKVQSLIHTDVKIKDKSKKNLSYIVIEFYSLIAMSCLMGGSLVIASLDNNLPQMSSQGKRIAIAPVKKAGLLLSSLFASYITQLTGLLLLFVYTIFVLKVNYGSNLGLIVLLSIAGSLAGLSLGMAIAVISKGNSSFKSSLQISVTMLGCFLAGMMGVTTKYFIDKNIPIINMLNPAGMITDGFYSLYYYDTLHRFFFNLMSLLAFSLILIIISIIVLRRQKYDSI
ncbi:ABC transporter permease [Eggerthia catenaformis]|uniref:ABC transporter permease n=1 Tax=Eggerthia catenaformis TaxID=31973 RepID=UPI00248D8BF5|nr:ABC transporter permease [Eggerthia catenaformis]